MNQLSLLTIGFYGDKQMMCRLLKDMIVLDHSIHKQMQTKMTKNRDEFKQGVHRNFEWWQIPRSSKSLD